MHSTIKAAHDMFLPEFPKGPDGKTPQYPQWFCDAMNLFDREANRGCDCHWVAPYGFVIDAGCPIHD